MKLTRKDIARAYWRMEVLRLNHPDRQLPESNSEWRNFHTIWETFKRKHPTPKHHFWGIAIPSGVPKILRRAVL